MSSEYYQSVRNDIQPLLPPTAKRIVDVGCGEGRTSAWLRTIYPDAHFVGLEGNPALRDTLSKNLDEVHIVDLNGPLPDVGAPDLILFLDVLEHVLDPRKVLTQLTKNLSPKGTVIVSVPNVAHWSVAIPLFFRGEFEYRDEGILDRTHLHFFTRRSAVELLTGSGFQVDKGLDGGIHTPKRKAADMATLGLLRSRLAKQYILAGHRPNGKPAGAIAWDRAILY